MLAEFRSKIQMNDSMLYLSHSFSVRSAHSQWYNYYF